MTAYYTIDTTNKFCLLEDSDDETGGASVVMTREARERAVGVVDAPKALTKSDSPRPKSPPKKQEVVSDGWQSGGDKGRRRQGEWEDEMRPPRMGGRGEGGWSGDRAVQPGDWEGEGEGRDARSNNRAFNSTQQRGRGGRGGGGGGGGGGGRGGYAGRGREFDRHSGTGRAPGEKKQGGGAHNWGKEVEIETDSAWTQGGEEQEGNSVVSPEKKEAQKEPEATKKEGEERDERRNRREEEPPSKSIEEWREEQRAARTVLPSLGQKGNTKAVIMTEEQLQKEGFFNSAKQANIKEIREKEVVIERGDDEVEVKHKRGGLTMNYYEFAAKQGNNHFKRGGRGARGGRGRGGERVEDEQAPPRVPVQPLIELDDQSQFPSLG
eukprot:GHVN01030387.1.p1 GENE.GHVN01030387.1~~GHVN01030387.1.p1  ORF type:complete len:380 (+),score=138.17 GHVN01030387.1:120-1259(+)